MHVKLSGPSRIKALRSALLGSKSATAHDYTFLEPFPPTGTKLQVARGGRPLSAGRRASPLGRMMSGRSKRRTP